MNSIDLTPLYRSSIGFDGLASMFDRTLKSEAVSPGHPPYNIEMLDDHHYQITLAVSGYEENELDISVEQGVLSVCGRKSDEDDREFLYRGIALGNFERQFNLADHVEVVSAELKHGLLTISLLESIPEAMKPKRIEINTDSVDGSGVIEHEAGASDQDDTEA